MGAGGKRGKENCNSIIRTTEDFGAKAPGRPNDVTAY
jgi:hypothetical protein